jgi:hypothetical protein
MIIVQSKSIEQQLKVLSLLDKPNTLLVVLQKDYIITKLFMKLIVEILILSIIFCHAQFDLRNSYMLLVVDGAIQHQSLDIINILKNTNIKMHFFVSHSSYLT